MFLRIAQSGLTADEIVGVGGIRAALAGLATSRSDSDTGPESGTEPEVQRQSSLYAMQPRATPWHRPWRGSNDGPR